MATTAEAGWQQDATDAALHGRSTRLLAQATVLESRDCDIRREDIEAEIDCIDHTRSLEDGVPTFDQEIGAYDHIEILARAAHTLLRRGDPQADTAEAALTWTKGYYERWFPGQNWQWSRAEHWAAEELSGLLALLETED